MWGCGLLGGIVKRVEETETRQVAALPVYVTPEGRVRVGLVTSRETRRWIVPKGWPMEGLRDDEAAGIEAKEEAGLRGKMLREPIGTYHYWQRTRTHFRYVAVTTFVMQVREQKKKWKEKAQREFEWVTLVEAVDRLQEGELASLVAGLPQNAAAWKFLHEGKTMLAPKGATRKAELA